MSTGPLTATGKAVSSQNALKSGLFSPRDFICDGEQNEYAQTRESLLTDLGPRGILENTFAAEILGAAWRLRRCGLIESTFAMIEDETLLERKQKSVDRARAQSHNILRRSMTELRKLQTERQIRMQLEIDEDYGLADSKHILNAMKLHNAVCGAPEEIPEELPEENPEELPGETEESLKQFEEMLQRELRLPGDSEATPSSFCKPAAPRAIARSLPRNKPCPCGSGIKYKKCCGGPAAAAQNQAA